MAKGGRSTFPVYNRALNGKLTEIIKDRRDQGDSFHTIAAILREHHSVEVDSDTVRRWYYEFVQEGA